jgi:hypothetical protein
MCLEQVARRRQGAPRCPHLSDLSGSARRMHAGWPSRGSTWPPSETWYMHVDALGEVEAIRAGDWQGRTALLSPFDNLINDRRRTERLWGFAFRNEMYVPKAKTGVRLLPVADPARRPPGRPGLSSFRPEPRSPADRGSVPGDQPTAALCGHRVARRPAGPRRRHRHRVRPHRARALAPHAASVLSQAPL